MTPSVSARLFFVIRISNSQLAAIARESGRSSIPETFVVNLDASGILDAPRAAFTIAPARPLARCPVEALA